jgi:hypothetical protein
MTTAEQKAARLARAKQHVAADRLRSGFYSDDDDHSTGNSVGCDAIDIVGWQWHYDNPYTIVAGHDGTPEWLERLRDAVFEGLPAERRAWWHVALAEALPVGVDLQPAYHQMSVAILTRTLEHRDTWGEPYGAHVAAAIEQTIAYHRDPSESARSAAMSAARSAAESAASASRMAERAESAARSAAMSAARIAATSAMWGAASAAWSVEGSAESAERSAKTAASALG